MNKLVYKGDKQLAKTIIKFINLIKKILII